MLAFSPSRGRQHAAYLYEQSLTIPGTDRELHKLAVALANDAMGLADALDEAYRVVRKGLDGMPDNSAWYDGLEQRLQDEAISIRLDPNRVSDYNIRLRQNTNPELVSRLRIDLRVVPDLKTLGNLMAANDTTGSRVADRVIRKNSVAFHDIVWSPAKEISIAYALANPSERGEILRVHREAVDTAMEKVEIIVGQVRTKGNRETADTTWIIFDHWQSRSGDPMLHSHAILLNIALSRATGVMGGLNTFILPYKSNELREAYNKPLAEGLRRIGIDAWYDSDRRLARVHGIPDDLVEAFSQRREIALELARGYAQAKGRNFDDLPKSVQRELTNAATMASRKKEDSTKGNESEWRSRAQANGWSIPELFATMPTGRYHRQHEEMDWDDDIKPNRNMPSL